MQRIPRIFASSAPLVLKIQPRFCIFVLLAFMLGFSSRIAWGQTYLESVGSPTFSTKVPVENGWVDLSNGRLHLEIPLGSFPQRGGRTDGIVLMYDSNIWWVSGGVVWEPNNIQSGGWRLVTSALYGTAFYDEELYHSQGGCGYYPFDKFSWTAPDGTQHGWPAQIATQYVTGGCSGSNPTASGYALDGSGFYMKVSNYTCMSVYAADGTLVYFGDPYSVFPGCTSPTVGPKDPNGNYYWENASLSWADTLGRAPVVVSGNGNVTTYSLPNAQGGTSTYTVTTEFDSMSTNFGQHGVTEYNGGVSVPQSIQLPDGSTYSFTYDSGTTAGHYGLLTSMTLPTGATVSYTWQVFTDAQGNNYEWLHQRTTPDGTWQYAQSVVNTCGSGQVNCQQTNTIAKPNGDTQAYTFTLNGGAWLSQAQSYTGSSSILSTVNQCWNFVNVNSNGQCAYGLTTASPATNVEDAATSTTVPIPSGNLTKTTEYAYDTYGNTTQIKEWKYYPASLPTSADRTTTIAYQQAANYVSANILNRPASVTVTSSGGGTVAQTLYTYDGGSLTSVTGMPGHDDTNYGTNNTTRGNVTLIQKLVSGSTYLNSSTSYDTTGQILTSADFNNNQTTDSYSGTYYNAYPTTVTNPEGQSSALAYDFNTGLITSITDANNQTINFTYDNMSRPLKAMYPNQGQDALTYTDVNPFNVQDQTKITSSSLNAIRTATLDSLGRQSTNTLNSDPDGATSGDTTYDANGRVYTVSHPYRSPSSPDLETYTYDGLDRQLTDTHPDGAVVKTYYGSNVTSAGGVASQQGASATYGYGYPVLSIDEAGNPRQSWFDGFGRVIETDEPTARTSATPGTGSITINGSEQNSMSPVGPNSPGSGGTGGASLVCNDGSADKNVLTASSFGFNLPEGSTIQGIEATIYKYGSYSPPNKYVMDSNVQLLNAAGSPVGSNYASATYWPGGNTAVNYGGSTDTWGTSWTYSDINSTGFGVTMSAELTCNLTNGTVSADVTAVQITVWYSTPNGQTYDSGTVSINVNGFQVSTTYQQGSTASSVASALATALNVSGSPVTASPSGSAISLTSNATGTISNYSFTGSSSTNFPSTFYPSFTVSPANGALAGGTDPGADSMSSPAATLYTYDLNDNLTGVTSAGGQQNVCNSTNSRCYSYDSLSRITTSTTPETGTTNVYYTNSSGNQCSGDPSEVCRRTDARNVTTTYSYDALNRLTSKSYSDGTPTANYYYDQNSYNGLTISNGKGRRTGMSDGSGLTAWNYDAMGNVLNVSKTIGSVPETISYSYNLDNSVATVTYPSGRVVTYTAGGAQRPVAAQDIANNINYAEATSFPMYAPTGAALNIVYGFAGSVFNGITETRAYNNRLGITSILASSSTATALSLAFSYNVPNNGNILTQTNNVDTGRTQNFKYDALNRVLSVETNATSGPDCWGQSFNYDALSNLLSADSVKCTNPAPQYSVNSNNQITNAGFSYDLAGNTTGDGLYTYNYDAENRIKSANGMSGGPYCYTYDGDGLRVAKSNGLSCSNATVDVLYWPDLSGKTIAETDSTGSTADANYHEYVFFAGRMIARSDPASGIQYYYFMDQLASTRSVAEVTPSNSPTDGTVCFSADYYPFGQEIDYSATCPQNYKFTGYQRDTETGLDNAFARSYNDRLGRFMSSDQLGGQVNNPQSLNRYSYVLNNPLALVDPIGLGPQDCESGTGPGCDDVGAPPSMSDLTQLPTSATYVTVTASPIDAGPFASSPTPGDLIGPFAISVTSWGNGGGGAGRPQGTAPSKTSPPSAPPETPPQTQTPGSNLSTKGQVCQEKVQGALNAALNTSTQFQGPLQGNNDPSEPGLINGAYNFNYFVPGVNVLAPGVMPNCGRFDSGLHVIVPGGCNLSGDPFIKPYGFNAQQNGSYITAHFDSANPFGDLVGFFSHLINDVILRRPHGC